MIQPSELSHRVCRYGASVFAAFFLLQTTVAPSPPQNAPPARSQGRRCRPSSLTIWWRRSPCIPIRWWRKCWPLPLTRWRSPKPNNGYGTIRSGNPRSSWTRRKNRTGIPAYKALVAFPDVLTQLTQDMSWTTQLGNAFLAQQADVMQAVQRMRAQAQAEGHAPFDAAGDRHHAEPERADAQSPSSRQIRMSGMCRITIPHTSGDRRSGEFIRRSFTPASI